MDSSGNARKEKIRKLCDKDCPGSALVEDCDPLSQTGLPLLGSTDVLRLVSVHTGEPVATREPI